jgi:hypothetical protein
MIDAKRLRIELDQRIRRFVEDIAALLPKTMLRRGRPRLGQERTRAPTPVADKRRSPPVAARRQSTSPAASEQTSAVPRPPPLVSPAMARRMRMLSPERITERVVSELKDNASGYSFDQLTQLLKVPADSLRPVLDRLTDERQVRAVEQDGIVFYRRPRIEPIRRTARQAAG